MKKKRLTNRWIRGAGLLAVAVMLLWTGPRMAAADGTPSGTDIDNRATVDYQVGGVDQTFIESSPTGNSTPGLNQGADTTFKVDTSLDMSVVSQDVAAVTGSPGTDDYVLTFEVTNDGNATQDFSLSAVPRTDSSALHGVTDTINLSNVRVFVESGDAPGYDALDVDTYIDELAADDPIIVYIVSDVPLTAVNGDGAIYDLVAQVAVGGTAGSQGADILTDDSGTADDPATVQVVFADAAGTAGGDGAYDGIASDDGVYEVASAALEVKKESTVVSDPTGSATPHAIPGAVIEYTITIDNSTGSSNATSVTITDTIPANTDFIIGSVTGDGDTVNYSDDNGATWTYSPGGANGDPDPDVDAVQIIFNAINSGDTESATFRVEVE